MKIRQALKLYRRSKHTLLKFRNYSDYDFAIGGNRMLYQSRYDLGNRWYIPIHNQKAQTRLVHYLKKNKNVAYVLTDKFDISVQIKAAYFRDIYLDNLPEIGKEYYTYDDGKIRPSRESIRTISNIISYKDAGSMLIKTWMEEVKHAYWLFSDTTDYFVQDSDNDIYARTIHGEWYGLTNNELLDVTGEYYKIAHQQ